MLPGCHGDSISNTFFLIFAQVLPGGEVHRYYMSSSTEASKGLQMGVLVSKITFVLPSSVAAVISLMRQQALLDTVLLSCLRPSSFAGIQPILIH